MDVSFFVTENKNFVICFAFLSPFTIFAYGEDRLHLRKAQINLAFHSVCTIFVQ